MADCFSAMAGPSHLHGARERAIRPFAIINITNKKPGRGFIRRGLSNSPSRLREQLDRWDVPHALDGGHARQQLARRARAWVEDEELVVALEPHVSEQRAVGRRPRRVARPDPLALVAVLVVAVALGEVRQKLLERRRCAATASPRAAASLRLDAQHQREQDARDGVVRLAFAVAGGGALVGQLDDAGLGEDRRDLRVWMMTVTRR